MNRPANDNIPGQLIPLMPEVVERLCAAADFLEALKGRRDHDAATGIGLSND